MILLQVLIQPSHCRQAIIVLCEGVVGKQLVEAVTLDKELNHKGCPWTLFLSFMQLWKEVKYIIFDWKIFLDGNYIPLKVICHSSLILVNLYWLRDWTSSDDFVSKLLVKKRLGWEGERVEEVKRHSWLKHNDWSDVLTAALSTPSHAEDCGNYQDYPEELWWEVVEVEREVFQKF